MGTNNQRAVDEWGNISGDLVYEWVRFFKGQVYDWGRFWNTGSNTRTTITPKLHPREMPSMSITNHISIRAVADILNWTEYLLKLYYNSPPPTPLPQTHTHQMRNPELYKNEVC